MRPTTTTTVVTYGILVLAGSIPLAMPDRLAAPVIPASRRVATEHRTDVTGNTSGMGYWSHRSSAASSSDTSPFVSSD